MVHLFQKYTNRLRMAANRRGLFDSSTWGMFFLAAVGIVVIWNGMRVVQQNYGLLQKIAVLEEENRIIELENKNKQIQNEYYKTAEFAELKARRVNGKAASGEKVYIVTNDVAQAALKTSEKAVAANENTPEKLVYQQNFEAWIDFFFGEK